MTLSFEDRSAVWYRFLSEGRLQWEVVAGPRQGEEGVEAADVFALRDDVYLVDYTRAEEAVTSVNLVADLARGIATAVIGRLPGPEPTSALAERIAAGKELTRVSAEFLSAAIDAPFTEDTPRHLPTSDLVGKRVEYTYGPTERYEHIYLNERFYTWHCLDGVEKGLADTDRCHYYGLGDDLYLFVWREKIIPTLGLVVLDLRRMRTVGKIFGYQTLGHEKPSAGLRLPERNRETRPVNFAVGARARLLNITTH